MYELALFAGAGGGILGGKLLGWQCVGAVEIERYPRKVLLQRQRDGILPWFPIWNDIKTFSITNPECQEYIEWLRTIRNQLVISGGFPCQDISTGGKCAGIDGSRSELWFEQLRVIKEIHPSGAFIENSPALRKLGLDVVLSGLACLGYDAKWCSLGTSDLGGHCKGKRFWLAASPSKSGREELVCGESRFSHKTRGPSESTANAYPCNRIERIHALEKMVGEPAILGSNDGMAHRLDRLHAIGNGQVPIVAATSWRILNQHNL